MLFGQTLPNSADALLADFGISNEVGLSVVANTDAETMYLFLQNAS